MNLSSELISQFVKVTNDKTETKKETTVYATAVELDGSMYVKIDGSEVLTPVETTTDMKNGERVTVMIKNHTATVTGNISSPSARTDTVKEIDGEVQKVGSQITDLEIVVADKVDVTELTAEKARIDTLVADNVTINTKLTANEAYISKVEAETVKVNGKLEANEAEISKLKTEKLDAASANIKFATIENLEATNADIYNLEATYGDFQELTTRNFEAVNGDIENLNANKLSVEDADIRYADIDELNVTNANVANLSGEFGDFKTLSAEKFSAVEADISDLETKKLSTESADIKYANIDFSNIGKATMEYFYAQSGLIRDVTVGDQTITGHLVGVTISGDLIEGNTIKAEKLVIKGSDGLYYQLNTDGAVTEAEQTDQNSLNGSIIRAKSITATKIDVQDLVAFGATIGGFHITDNSIYSGSKEGVGNTTRGLYLDNDGQFNFGDASNFVKFYKNSNGTYKLAIAADELVIGGSGTNVEDAIVGAQNAANNATTLANNAQNAADQAKSSIASVETRVTAAETQITKNNDAIALRATKTEVTDAKNAAIADTDNKLKNYSTTAQMNSALTVKANEITSHVSATYTTKEDFNNLDVGCRNLVTGTSDDWKSVTLDTYATTLKSIPIAELMSTHHIADGDTLTYSVIFKSNSSKGVRIRCQHYTSESVLYADYGYAVIKNGEGKVSISITLDSSYTYLQLMIQNADISITASTTEYYKCIKLEKGNKATDWTPAPEDIDTRIESAETRIKQTEKDIQLRATTEDMNAAIKVATDGISSEVSSAKSDINRLKNKVPWVSEGWVDARAYDESLWIPFIGNVLTRIASSRIRVDVALDSETKPGWSSHSSGFSVQFEVEDIGNGWGTNTRSPKILEDKIAFCSVSPVSYRQLEYSSTPILYLRGGGRYRIKTSFECTWTAYPDGYTWTSGQYSQSAPIYNSRPTPEGDSYAWQADMTAAKSKLDQQADSITAVVAKANQNETDIASLKLTSNAFEVRFDSVEDNVDTAIEKATLASNVGGRNYLTNAKRLNNWSRIAGDAGTLNPNHSECPNGVYFVGASGGNTTHRLSNVITSNGYWTVSFEIKGSQSTSVGFTLDICDLGSTVILCNTSNTWEKRSVTVNVNNYSSSIYHFVDFSNISWAYVFVRNIKIEKGSVATDWTPAPEDVDSAVSNAQSTANDAITLANNALADADSVKTDLANNYTKKTIPDTRYDNQNPQWYITNYPKQIITEFKICSAIGLSGETFCTLTTTVPWGDSSGGYPKQLAKVGSKEYWRVGTSGTVWGSWNDPGATATNYMKFENGKGLIVGNITSSTIGHNVRIDSDSVDICLNDAILASYQGNSINLGMRDVSSAINLCGDSKTAVGRITLSELVENTDYWSLNIASNNAITLSSGGEVNVATDYGDGTTEVHNLFKMISTQPWNNMTYSYVGLTSSGTNGTMDWFSGLSMEYSTVQLNHSKGEHSQAIVLNDSGIILDASNVVVAEEMIFATNNAHIYGTETDGTEVEVFQAKNSNNNTVLGYGNYTNNSGNTHVYGNYVNIYSKQNTAINANNEITIRPGAAGTTFRPYYHGVDSFNVTINTAGFVTSSGTSVRFVVPLSKPIIGNPTVTASSVSGLVLRQNGSYTHGSSASTYVTPSSYSVNTTNEGNHVVIFATMSSTTNVINNSPIGVQWSGKLTFAYG